MDLFQLEVFLTVAREGSFSRAAEKLYRTQPAVSQAIRKLEREVGESLFDRSSRDGTRRARNWTRSSPIYRRSMRGWRRVRLCS